MLFVEQHITKITFLCISLIFPIYIYLDITKMLKIAIIRSHMYRLLVLSGIPISNFTTTIRHKSMTISVKQCGLNMAFDKPT